MSAIISEIIKDSAAARACLRAGDKLIGINGTILRDIIDYHIVMEDQDLELLIERDGHDRSVRLIAQENEKIGIRFSSSIFDRVRTCCNNCVFCFLDQLPPGLRRSLYLKDDDFRLSFLYGNFITLTNLDPADIERIVVQRLSPLYVSLHSADPIIRKKMLRMTSDDHALSYLQDLLSAGTEIHLQLVLCPGMNDKEYLRNSLGTLELYFPLIKSIGIVPVGLTKFRQNLYPLKLFSQQESRDLIRDIQILQDRYRKEKNTSWVFLADEFYLLAGYPLPSYDHYEDFAQLENGIGIARLFLHQIDQALDDVLESSVKTCDSFTVVTGELAGPIMAQAFNMIQNQIGGDYRIAQVKNRFFGDTVTVAGLLTASDIVAHVRSNQIKSMLLIPEVMLDSQDRFLDDMSIEELQSVLKLGITKLPVDGTHLLHALRQLI